MVTLIKYGALSGGEKYNVNALSLDGLSTDTKPTRTYIEYGSDGREVGRMGIPNGSLYTEIDTGDTYMYDADNITWHKVSIGGGGGSTQGGIVLVGETTTQLVDNATTNPITVDGQSYTAQPNDAVIYGNKEFLFDGTKWHEFGDLSGLSSKDIGAMTNYVKAQTGAAIATTDTLNQAIGKVEKRVEVNENNILSVQTTVTGLTATVGTVSDEQDVLSARMDTFAQLTDGSTTGDAELQDIRVAANGITYSTAGDAVREQITAITNDINNLKLLTENTNLWTYGNDSFTNYKQYGTEGVTMYPAGIYVLTGKFKSSGDGGIRLYVYNSNTNFYININSSDDEKSYLINSADYPIDRLFFRAPQQGNYSDYTITLTDVKLTPKSNWYGYAYSNTTTWTILPYNNEDPIGETAIDDLARKYALSYWRNKKINYNGDSITQGLMPDRTGYVKVVNQILNFGTVRNYAVGGTRLAHVEGEANCLIDRYTDMSLDADIVFIMANTNDYVSQVPLGSADSVDTSTYNGALNVLLSWLKTNYPTQPIIISTMLTRKINYNGDQPLPITIEQYAQCVRDRASEHHVILYDAYKLSGMDLRTSPTDGTGITDDGLHPNRAGALALGRKIAAFINAQ